MIRYAPQSVAQIEALRLHYLSKTRIEVAVALDRALDQAEAQITIHPERGLPAPRPYPDLAHPGERWIKAGRYWIDYNDDVPPVILAVFYEAADIPGRL